MSARDVTPPKLPFAIKPRFIILFLIVVAVLGAASTMVFVVDQSERAVVTRFGAIDRTMPPGLHFKLPFGIERNYNVRTEEVQHELFGYRTRSAGYSDQEADRSYPEESIMLTGDLNIIDVEWSMQYRIREPVKWLFEVEDQRKTIRDISQSVVNQLVGDRAILNVIGRERTQIEELARDLMNELYDSYNLGVNVTQVRLQNTVPPVGRVQDAFEDVNRAVQDMNRLINEGREQYNREIPRIRGEAREMIEVARGRAERRVNRADGDVARFNAVLAQYQNEPTTTRKRLYYEMIENVFNADGGETVLIDSRLDNVLPFLNLSGGEPAALPGGAQ